MSVHSLIIPQSTVVLTVLIQSYRASWNCSLVVSHGILLRFVFYVSVCVCLHAAWLGVFNLLLLSSRFMGLLSIDCAVLQEREIASHSWSVTLSLSLTLPFSLGLFFSPSSPPLFLSCLGGWPQLARHPGRAMPEGAPCSWQIVRCSSGSWGEARGWGLGLGLMEYCGFEKHHDGFPGM